MLRPSIGNPLTPTSRPELHVWKYRTSAFRRIATCTGLVVAGRAQPATVLVQGKRNIALVCSTFPGESLTNVPEPLASLWNGSHSGGFPSNRKDVNSVSMPSEADTGWCLEIYLVKWPSPAPSPAYLLDPECRPMVQPCFNKQLVATNHWIHKAIGRSHAETSDTHCSKWLKKDTC